MNHTMQLTRRTLLAASAAVGGAAALSELAGPSIARAQAGAPGRVVVIYLRGGQDHLSTAIPYTDAQYYGQRPTIAIPDDRVLDLDGTFGFHPALAGLHALYGEGRVGVVVAAGNPAGDRSHFSAQDLSEYGDVETPDDGFGWIGRHLLATASSSASPFRAVSVGDLVASSLRGFPALGLSTIDGFGLGGRSGATSGGERTFRALYAGNRTIEQYGTSGLDAAEEVGALTGSDNPNPLLQRVDDLVALFAADLGVEVATLDIGGWDTHNAMGDVDTGDMRSQQELLDLTISHLQAGLDAAGQSDVITVVMTEFGRRVAENGSGGTDHGWGSVMLVVGDGAAGGVHGSWPGLSPATIGTRGDVPVVTDYRDVLGEVLSAQTGIDPNVVFPGHSYSSIGVTAV